MKVRTIEIKKYRPDGPGMRKPIEARNDGYTPHIRGSTLC